MTDSNEPRKRSFAALMADSVEYADDDDDDDEDDEDDDDEEEEDHNNNNNTNNNISNEHMNNSWCLITGP